jgi:hypothetical protein
MPRGTLTMLLVIRVARRLTRSTLLGRLAWLATGRALRERTC